MKGVRVDIGKAFSFVFDDEEWVSKILIGGLIALIPIVGLLAWFGFMIQTARNVAYGVAKPLPSWSPFGELIKLGFYGFVINLVYVLPALIIYFGFSCLLVPIAGVLAEGGGNSDAAGGAIGLLFLGCVMPLFFILLLGGVFLSYYALAQFVVTNQLAPSLRVGEVIAGVRRNWTPWLIMILVALLSSIVASAGSIACGVGALFTSIYAYAMLGHALGQTAREQGMVPQQPTAWQ